MKKLAVLLLSFMPLLVEAQEILGLKFVEEVHDFGLIKEEDGPAEFKFEFTNVSSEPITITNVRASCGCTTPSWTREPVIPGGSGFITAVYNPLNRPGPFNKTLTVTNTSKQATIMLRIQGRVEPKPRTIEDDFPTVMGGIRTKYRAFNMGKVFTDAAVNKEFEVYNQSDKTIAFTGKIDAPPYIQVSFQPTSIAPQQKGKIIVRYDATRKKDLGFMSDGIAIYTDEEPAVAQKNFTVYADINEYFAPMSPENAAMAPKLLIEQNLFDFGTIEQGTTQEATFTLKNDGKSPLNIRQTVANCTCTVVEMENMDIQPNQSVEMKVKFDTTGRRGTQQKTITIYSSDPVNPVQRVILKATISAPSN